MRQEEISSVVDAANVAGTRALLRNVAGWKIFAFQSETIARQQRANFLLGKLEESDGWLDESKEFLYRVARSWPALCAGWVP